MTQIHQEKEYIIFCDESDKAGKYFSNFYGGVLVGATQYQKVTERLNLKKTNLNLYKEVKWAKVTERYLEKYEALIKSFFKEVASRKIKVRIMFRQNAYKPSGLTKEQMENEYFLLYYQFIKHSFGLEHINPSEHGTNLRLYFDQFPDTKEKAERFKGYLLALQEFKKFRDANIVIHRENITEILSHDHVLVQCLDMVVGAMTFRLNDKHKEKEEGKRIRGKKTRAKEALYKTILTEIRKIYPNFNIGISTGLNGSFRNKWVSPYLHWNFKPNSAQYVAHLTKKGGSK